MFQNNIYDQNRDSGEKFLLNSPLQQIAVKVGFAATPEHQNITIFW